MPSCSGEVRLDDLLQVCRAGERFNGALLLEMLQLFIDDNRRRVDAALKAASRRDARTFANVAHAIKGSAGLVGAVCLQRLAGDFEVRVSDSTTELTANAQRLLNEFTAVVTTLRSLYPDLRSA